MNYRLFEKKVSQQIIAKNVLLAIHNQNKKLEKKGYVYTLLKVDDHTIKISHQDYIARDYAVEADWSSASVWYQIAALSKECHIKLKGLREDSIQADNFLIKLFKDLSVESKFHKNDLILKGSVIDLEVGIGLGNQVFEAPDLINLDLEEARFTIIGSGLKLGNIIYQDSGYFYNKILDEEGKEIFEKSFVYPGKVFKQSPAKSTKVKIGRRVNLWIVSKPKDEII